MMLDINLAALRAGFVRNAPVAVLVALLIGAQMILVLGYDRFGLDKFAAPVAKTADYNNTEALGLTLFTQHLYAFEIAAVILLVGIIAAISLTLRRRPTTKYQDPSKQVQVKAKDRLQVIKMDAEVDA
jgi:NADH-quinone oxidoreductase subunit J